MKSFNAGTLMVALVMAALGFMSCSSNNAKLLSITVTPVDPVKVSGIQFTATGIFSDGNVLNYTSEVIWSSSNPAVATVGTTVGLTGYVTVLTTGTTTITAVEPYNNYSSSSRLTIVTPSAITITPENPVMAKGTSHQFDAIATFVSPYTGATGTQSLMSSPTLTWTSSSNILTTVSQGLVTTGTITGSVDITATAEFFSSISGTIIVSGTTALRITPTSLTSITVTPSPANIAINFSQPFFATGNYNDLTTGTTTTLDFTSSVNWTSSSTGTVLVSNITGSKGSATTVGLGSAFIVATDPISSVTGSASVLVY